MILSFGKRYALLDNLVCLSQEFPSKMILVLKRVELDDKIKLLSGDFL